GAVVAERATGEERRPRVTPAGRVGDAEPQGDRDEQGADDRDDRRAPLAVAAVGPPPLLLLRKLQRATEGQARQLPSPATCPEWLPACRRPSGPRLPCSHTT